ncbi:hypothetical protein AB4Y40_33835 [Paraburkholderia sp. EG287B]|uniref:hypothetical protein n=1 Tax=Paraburkholderia sp. EG287B TaxID=3237010 RepID=UPI0034D2EC92
MDDELKARIGVIAGKLVQEVMASGLTWDEAAAALGLAAKAVAQAAAGAGQGPASECVALASTTHSRRMSESSLRMARRQRATQGSTRIRSLRLPAVARRSNSIDPKAVLYQTGAADRTAGIRAEFRRGLYRFTGSATNRPMRGDLLPRTSFPGRRGAMNTGLLRDHPWRFTTLA